MFFRIIAGLLLLPSVAIADELSAAKSHVAQELADCGAYYMLLGDLPGIQVMSAPETAAQTGLRAVQAAADYSNPDTALMRFRLAMLHIKNGLESNWDNVQSFRQQLPQCDALLQTPDRRVAYWMQSGAEHW